jgi:hypothetical protein
LREHAVSPVARESFSPLGTWLSVILAAGMLEQLEASPDRRQLAGWLEGLSCPVLGIGPGTQAAGACDVVVASERELEPILANIERAPLAATVLVQVLRATAAMPVAAALTVESLAYATLQAGPEFRRWLANRAVQPAAATPSDAPPVLLDRHDDDVTMILNRPDRLNAFSVEMRDALCEALQLVIGDSTIRSVSIAGAGRCFSIGGDLDEFGVAPDPATAHAIRSVRLPAFYLSQCADRVRFRLHGACIGAGIELPAVGQRVVAAGNSFFQLPELRFGLIPGAGGCVGIPRRIGRQRTAWLALSGRRISAAKALDWGLIDAIED